MLKFKFANSIYDEAALAVSSVEADVRRLQADIANLKGEKIVARRRLATSCDYYDEFGRQEYLSDSDLRREIEAKIYSLEKKLTSAKEELVKKQAELERVRLLLAEEEALASSVVEDEDGLEDLVF